MLRTVALVYNPFLYLVGYSTLQNRPHPLRKRRSFDMAGIPCRAKLAFCHSKLSTYAGS
jgi:hypothetical protein